MRKSLRIGFIGLGKMGAGMCANIQKEGFPLTVYNRTRSKCERFKEQGAVVADSPRQVAENSDIILSSLMDDGSVINLCRGQDGILAGLTPDTIHLGLTTIQPATSNRLGKMHMEKHGHYIAAPVAGRPDAAEAAELISFLGGDSKAIEQAGPVVQCYSKKVVPTGDSPGTASATKVCVNYMAMTQLVMLGEMYTFAEKSGVDREMIFMMARVVYGGAGPMAAYAEKIKNRSFDDAGFELTAGLKDALVFEKAFVDAGVRPGTVGVAKENLVAAVANGLGNKDWSALTEMTRRAAGLDSQV